MKITNARAHILEAKLSQPFAYSRAWYDTRTAMLVEIETDDGLTGWNGPHLDPWRTPRPHKPVRPYRMYRRTSWRRIAGCSGHQSGYRIPHLGLRTIPARRTACTSAGPSCRDRFDAGRRHEGICSLLAFVRRGTCDSSRSLTNPHRVLLLFPRLIDCCLRLVHRRADLEWRILTEPDFPAHRSAIPVDPIAGRRQRPLGLCSRAGMVPAGYFQICSIRHRGGCRDAQALRSRGVPAGEVPLMVPAIYVLSRSWRDPAWPHDLALRLLDDSSEPCADRGRGMVSARCDPRCPYRSQAANASFSALAASADLFAGSRLRLDHRRHRQYLSRGRFGRVQENRPHGPMAFGTISPNPHVWGLDLLSRPRSSSSSPSASRTAEFAGHRPRRPCSN